jgi:hypothetical protein
MLDGQLELSFENGGGRRLSLRERRHGRAHWWFERMRRLVDRAIDWRACPTPPPEQIWLPGAHRQVGEKAAVTCLTQPPAPDERQICE